MLCGVGTSALKAKQEKLKSTIVTKVRISRPLIRRLWIVEIGQNLVNDLVFTKTFLYVFR
jgi:hypothetical protein